MASERVRRVGLVRAQGDRRLVGHLRDARQHASKAIKAAERARRKRRNVGRTATIAVGAGALAGSAYVGWKVYGAPSSMPSSPAAQPLDETPRSAPSDETNRSQVSGETDAETDGVL
jgi:cytochrome c-type biogenesis protein CcmH/NrfG